jgi:hypothetical protein
MSWKDEWIELTPVSTPIKQRVRKSSIGYYGKVGRYTMLQRDVFDSSANFPVVESVEYLDKELGRNPDDPNYQRDPRSYSSSKITRTGRSCANCLYFDKSNTMCSKKQYVFGDDRPMDMLCSYGDWV